MKALSCLIPEHGAFSSALPCLGLKNEGDEGRGFRKGFSVFNEQSEARERSEETGDWGNQKVRENTNHPSSFSPSFLDRASVSGQGEKNSRTRNVAD